MSNPGIDQDSDGEVDALAAVAARWNDDDRIGPLLSAADGVFLIIDSSGGVVLHASSAALPLRSGIAAPDGRLDPAVGLDAQISRAGLGVDRPALARLQFDRRRLKPPVTCLAVQAPGPGGVVTALFLTGQAPRLRSFVKAPREATALSVLRLPSPKHEHRPTAEPAPLPEPEVAFVPSPDSPPRFTWRSDGDGFIRTVSGPAGQIVRSVMAGRSWQTLVQTRVLADAEGLLAALADRRTFRAITLLLKRPETSQILEVELSGVPLARSDQPFNGYGGFGLLRPLAVGEMSTADPSPEDGAHVGGPDLGVTAAPPDEADTPRDLPALRDDDASGAADSLLSGDEHDAFREIARALGARFSGDALPDMATPDGPGAAVMPFPRSAMRPIEAPSQPDAADGGAAVVLDGLPAAIMICRDGAALFANRSFLDLAGFETLAEIDASGGLTRLFHGLSTQDLTRSDPTVLLARREGGSIGISAARSTIVWEDAPADLLLIREAEAATADPAIAALREAQDFAGRRSGEATAVLDSLEDGILAVDPGGRILSLNRRAASMFGLDPREVVGGGIATLFAPESAAEILVALREPNVTEPKPRRVFAKGGDGLLPVTLRLLALRQGPERRVVLVLREAPRPAVDQAEAGRRAAEATSALRSEVLAKISHEIRTPMTGILGFADVMLTEQFGPFNNERYRDCLRDIRASGEHVLNVVTDLLDLASIEAGRRDLAFTDVPLNEIVSNCVIEMQPQAARDRIVIRTSFSENLTRLVADERSVRQAALNVISNALRFTEAGGQVIVSTTMADRGEIALRVRDTGVGMTPDEIAMALEPYRDSTATFPKAGTGLGLTITKALVEANHGRFRITSRKDEGTLVEMLFPTEQALSA